MTTGNNTPTSILVQFKEPTPIRILINTDNYK